MWVWVWVRLGFVYFDGGIACVYFGIKLGEQCVIRLIGVYGVWRIPEFGEWPVPRCMTV